MWTTPAPPSTAFVAASIWSGTGAVKPSPGQAASSIPRPTNPPWSGSWPEPPPEMSATFPETGASLRRTSWFSRSMLTRSGCAAPRPASDSLTTSSGLLRNFFTVGARTLTALSFLAGRRRLVRLRPVGLGDGVLDRPHDLPRRGDQVICERRQGRSDQVRRDVGAECLEPVVGVRAVDRLHEERPELARRVDRRVGDGADGDDDRDDDEPDHEPGPALGRAGVDDPEHGEHQDRSAEGLDEHRRAPTRHRVVEVHHSEAVAQVLRPVAERGPDREPAEDG